MESNLVDAEPEGDTRIFKVTFFRTRSGPVYVMVDAVGSASEPSGRHTTVVRIVPSIDDALSLALVAMTFDQTCRTACPG